VIVARQRCVNCDIHITDQFCTRSYSELYDTHKFAHMCVWTFVFYMCLFDVKILEDNLKKIKTCRSVKELYVKVYV
jgi:hypothetical protein